MTTKQITYTIQSRAMDKFILTVKSSEHIPSEDFEQIEGQFRVWIAEEKRQWDILMTESDKAEWDGKYENFVEHLQGEYIITIPPEGIELSEEETEVAGLDMEMPSRDSREFLLHGYRNCSGTS